MSADIVDILEKPPTCRVMPKTNVSTGRKARKVIYQRPNDYVALNPGCREKPTAQRTQVVRYEELRRAEYGSTSSAYGEPVDHVVISRLRDRHYRHVGTVPLDATGRFDGLVQRDIFEKAATAGKLHDSDLSGASATKMLPLLS